ncbi:response regulator transcription factor [Desulfoscipio sp. XC116]|uniref:response regulator transcription factor n=1 Tax=Desulfoscipio sp. XC116 TaxID=3144975 RepID=UPI00325AB5FE
MGELIRILLVEDDESLSRGISFKLSKEGFTVLAAGSLVEARELYSKNTIDLMVLDVALPDGDGFQFCREIRRQSEVFIVFLTACDQEVDIVMGYDMGADDYISKPFSLSVLVLKINAVLRRGKALKGHEMLVSKEIILYLSTMRLFKNEQEIYLTKTEMKLFRYLTQNPQQIISKEQFLDELWDIDGDFINENTLQVHIRRLREKIEASPSKPQYIKTIRGAGYIWAERCVYQ